MTRNDINTKFMHNISSGPDASWPVCNLLKLQVQDSKENASIRPDTKAKFVVTSLSRLPVRSPHVGYPLSSSLINIVDHQSGPHRPPIRSSPSTTNQKSPSTTNQKSPSTTNQKSPSTTNQKSPCRPPIRSPPVGYPLPSLLISIVDGGKPTFPV